MICSAVYRFRLIGVLPIDQFVAGGLSVKMDQFQESRSSK